MSWSSIWKTVSRRRAAEGTCAACGTTVHADERWLRIHGLLLHRRCVAYRPRRSRSG